MKNPAPKDRSAYFMTDSVLVSQIKGLMTTDNISRLVRSDARDNPFSDFCNVVNIVYRENTGVQDRYFVVFSFIRCINSSEALSGEPSLAVGDVLNSPIYVKFEIVETSYSDPVVLRWKFVKPVYKTKIVYE